MKISKRPGLLAKKVGMTKLYLDSGKTIPVTLLHLDHCSVISSAKKTVGEDTYWDIHLGAGLAKEKNVTKPLKGIYDKAGLQPRYLMKSFHVFADRDEHLAFFKEKNISDEENTTAESLESTSETKDITEEVIQNHDTSVDAQNHWVPGHRFLASYFSIGSYVDITGITIGRGFAGGMKRHNFSGLRATHGVSVSHRSHGSTGNRKDPGRTFKNKKMAGHMGCVQITTQNLEIVDFDIERNLIIVKGNIPGFESSWVTIQDAIKKGNAKKKISILPNITNSCAL